jgi:hypothetical protein
MTTDYNVGTFPSDIAIDSAGNLHVLTSQGVSKINPAGVVTNTILANSGKSIIVDNLNNVYFANSLSYSNIYKIDPNGVLSPSNTYGYGFGNGGMAVDQANNIYTQAINGYIIKSYPNQTHTNYDRFESNNSNSGGGYDITVDSLGNVYVPTFEKDNVTKYTPTLLQGISNSIGCYNNKSTSTDNIVQYDGPTLGVQTGVASGIVNGPAPTIYLTGNTVADGTIGYYSNYYNGQSIQGTFQGGNLVPNPDQNLVNVSSGQGQNIYIGTSGLKNILGTINITGLPDTLGSSVPQVKAIIGGLAPNVYLTGSNVAEYTPATLTFAGSASPVLGDIFYGIFRPNVGQLVPSDAILGDNSAVLSVVGVPSINIPTNVSSEIMQFPEVITPFNQTLGTAMPNYFYYDTTTNIPNGTPATFTPAGSSTALTGFSNSNNFYLYPNNQLLPLDATAGPASGTLKALNVQDKTIATNFAAIPSNRTFGTYRNIMTGPIDQYARIQLYLTGHNIPDGTPAIYTLDGTGVALAGFINWWSFWLRSEST